MNLNDVKTCLLLAEEQHFGRAAARAHLTQPAVSQALKRLEREYGVRIFERDSRGVSPTQAGELMIPHMRALVERSQALYDVAELGAEAATSRLVVGFLPVLRPTLRRWISDVAERRPGVCVVPQVMKSSDQRVGLLERTLDVAFLPEALVPSRHVSVALPPLQLSVLASLKSRSGVGLGTLFVPDVQDAAVVRPPAACDARRAGVALEAPLRFVATPEEMIDQVLAGQGAGLFDPTHVDESLRPRFRMVSLARPAATATYYAVAREEVGAEVRGLLGLAAGLPKEGGAGRFSASA
jgi:DNA-binding transcriptional LysR family regulator